MNEKLCIFCKNFNWTKHEMWGMGSTQTGPMFGGGDATCAKGRYKGRWDNHPEDAEDFREIILRAKGCPDYEPDK